MALIKNTTNKLMTNIPLDFWVHGTDVSVTIREVTRSSNGDAHITAAVQSATATLAPLSSTVTATIVMVNDPLNSTTIKMYDDGNHGDGAGGDGLFGGDATDLPTTGAL